MMPGDIPVRVRQMRREADSVVSVELDTLDGQKLPPAAPGAHVDVQLGPSIRRSYSLTEAISASPRLTIAIHRDPASRGGSAYVHDVLRVGQQTWISAPKNNFPLQGDADRSILIAGGIGITPILAMVRHLTANGRIWQLFYAARTASAAAFKDELKALAAKAGSKASLVFHFDDAAGGAPLNIADTLRDCGNAHIYCCGPAAMLKAFEAATAALPPTRVHLEHFSSTEEIARDGGFEVVLAKSGRTLHVDQGETILDTLISAGISVPFACTEGTCGTCETRVLEGVPDHRDMILTEAERAANDTMMVCCSGAKSPRLVLDL